MIRSHKTHTMFKYVKIKKQKAKTKSHIKIFPKIECNYCWKKKESNRFYFAFMLISRVSDTIVILLGLKKWFEKMCMYIRMICINGVSI